jgi:hypothetical protein
MPRRRRDVEAERPAEPRAGGQGHEDVDEYDEEGAELDADLEDDEDDDEDEYDDDEDEDEDEQDGGPGGNGRPPRATAVEAIRAAMRLVAQLTGRPAEGVVSMAPADDGWSVGVEVVETRRIPDSADILAVYEATVDGHLELTGFRRTRRYSRGQVDAR